MIRDYNQQWSYFESCCQGEMMSLSTHHEMRLFIDFSEHFQILLDSAMEVNVRYQDDPKIKHVSELVIIFRNMHKAASYMGYTCASDCCLNAQKVVLGTLNPLNDRNSDLKWLSHFCESASKWLKTLTIDNFVDMRKETSVQLCIPSLHPSPKILQDRLSRMSGLCIEEDCRTRELIANQLSQYLGSVKAVESYEEAEPMVRNESPFDIVFADAGFQGEHCEQFDRVFRDCDPSMQIVLTVLLKGRGMFDQVINPSVTGFLDKMRVESELKHQLDIAASSQLCLMR